MSVGLARPSVYQSESKKRSLKKKIGRGYTVDRGLFSTSNDDNYCKAPLTKEGWVPVQRDSSRGWTVTLYIPTYVSMTFVHKRPIFDSST